MSRKTIFILIILFAAWAFIVRLFPHVANMTPLGALALFAGAYLPRRWAYVVPLSVLLVSDAWLGGYELPVMLSVYGSFVLIALIARTMHRLARIGFIIVGPLASSTLFFIVTNFAVWAATPWYTKDFAGLLMSYTLALPFWRNMFVGDIMYTAAFFGIALVMQKIKKKNLQFSILNFH